MRRLACLTPTPTRRRPRRPRSLAPQHKYFFTGLRFTGLPEHKLALHDWLRQNPERMLTSPLYFGFSSQYTLNLTHIRSRPGSRSEPESEPKSKSEYQPGSGSRQCEAVVRRGVLLLRLLDHVAFVDDRASLQPLANLAALPLQLQRATTAAAPRGGQPKARVRHEGCNPYQGCNPITRDTPQRTRDTTLRTRAATLCECTSDAPRELAALRRQQERQREACGAPSRHAAQPVLDRALPGKL